MAEIKRVNPKTGREITFPAGTPEDAIARAMALDSATTDAWQSGKNPDPATRKVRFEGKTHVFPSDFTDDEVAEALQSVGSGAAAPAVAQQPTLRPGYVRARAALEAVRAKQNAWERDNLPWSPKTSVADLITGQRPAQNRSFTDQALFNLGVGDEISAAAAYVGAAGGNLFKPAADRIDPSEAARAAYDLEREAAAVYAKTRPALNTAAGVTGSLMFAPEKAATALSAVPALRQGAMTAAVNFPFAFARPDGDLGDRAKGAAVESALVFGVGSGLQGFANRLTGSGAARAASGASGIAPVTGPSMAQKVAAFDQAGVRPTLAAVAGRGSQSIAKVVAENPIAGARTRTALQGSLDDTERALERIAGEYGAPLTRETAGAALRTGIEGAKARFDNAFRDAYGSFTNSATALEDSFRNKAIAAAKQKAIQAGRTQKQTKLFTIANVPREQRPIELSGSEAFLSKWGTYLNSPQLRQLFERSPLKKIEEAIANQNGSVRFHELRWLRSHVRELQNDPRTLHQNLDHGFLEQMEGALTADMFASAQRIGGPALRAEIAALDSAYKSGIERVTRTMQPYMRATTTDAAAYDRLIARAVDRGGTSAKELTEMKSALEPQEWGQLAATAASRLGKRTEDSPFSVSTLVTNYTRLSPDAKEVLFGARGGGGARAKELQDALDNLAEVARMQAAVEAAANSSKTFVAGQSLATLGAGIAAAQDPGLLTPVLATLGGMAAAGEIMTNPAFVRWLSGVARPGSSAPGALQRQMADLQQIAAGNPQMQLFVGRLVAQMREGDGRRSLTATPPSPPQEQAATRGQMAPRPQ